MPRLIIIKGTDEGKQFDMSETALTVGRDARSQIRLHDTEVSRRHAEFRFTADGHRLFDLGSANGTFVNNQPIKDVLLQSGDHIQIGQTVLVYSGTRTQTQEPGDLAKRINMIARHELELSAAIIKTIGETEGSRILAQPEQAQGPWLKTALANLGIMYEAIQAVSHILDVDQLLERIMDLIFRSIDADRGCIMLLDADTGQFEPQAVHWRAGAGHQEKMTISRTIMDYVLREKQGVLVADAKHDERFAAGQSIARFGIREVICVPMKGRHETLGVLYLDTRTTMRDLANAAALEKEEKGSGTFSAAPSPLPLSPAAGERGWGEGVPDPFSNRFSEDHLALAIAIAHQAALAVEETRYHQAMVQAERLAAVGQTIAALSHHIKNILQGLRSGGEILKMGLTEKNDAMLQQGWKIVEKNQGKIYDLVMDMLSFSKDREPLLEETDVNQVVGDVLELMQGRGREKDLKLESRLDPDLPSVQADPEGVHRAVLNIVSNAFDAVEERDQPQVGVATALEPGGDCVRITVLDNGIGIAQAKLEDIFKPFVSTKGARGTGLGLAVSRKILREHGGDILVQSQPGKGSKFVLRLPVKSPLQQESGGAHPAEPPERPGEEET